MLPLPLELPGLLRLEFLPLESELSVLLGRLLEPGLPLEPQPLPVLDAGQSFQAASCLP